MKYIPIISPLVIMKKGIQKLYLYANELAKKNNQTVGKKKDYYITLNQLGQMLLNLNSTSNEQEKMNDEHFEKKYGMPYSL